MKTNPEEFSAFIGERAWGGYLAAVGVGCLAFWGILCALTLINVLIADHGTMLGSLRITGVIIGACVVTIPGTFAIGSVLALFPFLLTYAVAKFLHIRNMSYFIVGGGLVAALVCGSFFSIALSSWVSPWYSPFAISPFYFVCGALGGLVYWRIAVRFNGNGLGQVATG